MHAIIHRAPGSMHQPLPYAGFKGHIQCWESAPECLSRAKEQRGVGDIIPRVKKCYCYLELGPWIMNNVDLSGVYGALQLSILSICHHYKRNCSVSVSKCIYVWHCMHLGPICTPQRIIFSVHGRKLNGWSLSYVLTMNSVLKVCY